MLDVYVRMFEEFNPIWRQKIRSNQFWGSGSYTLTADEIDRVVKAPTTDKSARGPPLTALRGPG